MMTFPEFSDEDLREKRHDYVLSLVDPRLPSRGRKYLLKMIDAMDKDLERRAERRRRYPDLPD